jgi:hypothetical protein
MRKKKYAHVGQELLVQDAELRRLRRVVRAAEWWAETTRPWVCDGQPTVRLRAAVAAYRKGKKG